MLKNKIRQIRIVTAIVLVISAVFTFSGVKAVSIGGDNGSGSGSAGTLGGDWQPGGYGIRITVVNEDGKRAKGTKTFNIVSKTTHNGQKIHTSKENNPKIKYILENSNVTFDNKTEKVTTGLLKGFPDISTGKNVDKLSQHLRSNNYSNLKEYLKKIKYKCVENPGHSDCENATNHYVIIEPLLVIGNSGTGYNYVTGYELAHTHNNSNLASAFITINNALYSNISYKFGRRLFEKGSLCDSYSNCQSVLSKTTSNGMGIYQISDIAPTKKTITLTKEWKAQEGTEKLTKKQIAKIKSTFVISYYDKSWKEAKTVTISGEESESIDLTKGTKYRVKETNVSGLPDGYTWQKSKTKYKVANKKQTDGRQTTDFEIDNLKTVKVTYVNYYKSKDGEVTINVYPKQVKETYSTYDLLSSARTNNYTGYYFKRRFGGYTRNNPTYSNAKDVKIKSGGGWYGPIYDNTIWTATYGGKGLTKCQAYGNNIYSDDDSIACFQLCHRTVAADGSDNEQCFDGINASDNRKIAMPTEWLENYNENYTIQLQRLNGKNWKKQDQIEYVAGTMDYVSFEVEYEEGAQYRIVQSCSKCKNTYIKIARDTSTYRSSKESKAFTLQSDDKNKVIDVSIINNKSDNQENSCDTDLQKIKDNANSYSADQIKSELMKLHQNYQYNQLYNFTPADTKDILISKLNSNEIACGDVTVKTQKGVAESSCGNGNNSATANISLDDNTNISNYTNGDAAQTVANDLFGLTDTDQAYCYANYNVSYGNVIKNNQELFNASFLWTTIDPDIGTLSVALNCVGNSETKGIFNSGNLKNIDSIKSIISDINIDSGIGELTQISIGSGTANSGEGYISSDSNFQYSKYIINFPISYQQQQYANILSGTITNDQNDTNLGYGVRVPSPTNNGKGIASIIYNLDADSAFYKLLDLDVTSLSSECNYNRQVYSNCEEGKCGMKNDFKVRFIDTNNPFSGRDGNQRNSGTNWNTCLSSVMYRVGQLSNYTANDLLGNNSDKLCQYGDYNCDGTLDTNIQNISLNKNQIKIMDVNLDGVADNKDIELIVIKKDKSTISDIQNACESIKETDNSYVDIFISKAKNSSSMDTPMYSFTLSANDISNIRKYNNENKNYNNSTGLNCSGAKCTSTFITNLISGSNNLKVSSYSGECFNDKYKISRSPDGNNIERLLCSNNE